jgi:hypothetical protein
MIKIADRVKETSLTQGVGTLTLEGAYGGFQSFASGIGDGNSTYYAIENESRWEVGVGSYQDSSNTLTRDTVLDSSEGGDKINIAGVSVVFCTYPAKRALIKSGVDSEAENSFNGTVYATGLNISRSSPGNFIEAKIDDSYDKTFSIHSDGGISPKWKLGLSSPGAASPSRGYAYGEDGVGGFQANSTNSFGIANNADFSVRHNNVRLIEASSFTGINFTTNSPAYPCFSINAGPGQSASLQEWNDSNGSTVSSISRNGDIETVGSVTLVKTLKILDVPSYDPGVVGAVWKDGNHLMISDG